MASISTTIMGILLILFCVSAAFARTISGQDGMHVSSPVANDGICKTMVEPLGYTCEEHMVTTKDGYILSIQRIPVGRSGETADKPPVLLQHGLLSDARTWLMNPPDESLAFILADNGFDVWLSNTRGTEFSRKHTSLTPTDSAYWDWSWDQLAAYDLSAFVQFVHDRKGKNLHYVGHSLGTLMALTAFSQQKVMTMLRSAAMFCPIAYMDHMASKIVRAAVYICLAEDLYEIELYEFDPRGGTAVEKYIDEFCEISGINCTNFFKTLAGHNCCLNISNPNIILGHPQPTATKNMVHLAQMIRTGTIAMYDYGSEDGNKDHYGQPTPPLYNMSSISKNLPLFFGHGGRDELSDVNDVHTLLENLQGRNGSNLVHKYVEDYGHSDFVNGMSANKVVYNLLMDFFKLH